MKDNKYEGWTVEQLSAESQRLYQRARTNARICAVLATVSISLAVLSLVIGVLS